MTMILMTGESLTGDQRGWSPGDVDEAITQWPAVRDVETWEGQLLFLGHRDSRWDWRSVAMAVRAFPEARVELRRPDSLAVIFRPQSANSG